MHGNPRTRHAGRGAVIGCLVFGLLWGAALSDACAAPPSFDTVRAQHQPSDVDVVDRQGRLVQRLRVDLDARRGAWTAVADVSPALRLALVLSEDRRFFEHGGVDWHAVSAAAWGRLWQQRSRGASTITMQLAGLLDDSLRMRVGGRSMGAKLGQMVAAQDLEAHWRKDQILEAYLNFVPFRGELVGIDALARTLFGKAPHGLDEQEAALAVALLRAPNAAPAQVIERACGVWRELRSWGRASAAGGATADCKPLRLWAGVALQQKAWPASEGQALHAARQALRERDAAQTPAGARRGAGEQRRASLVGAAPIPTTLDADLQALAAASLRRHLIELRGRHVEDGAVVVLDNASGEVRAWIGSSGALSAAREVDAVLALRQPGSALKPFLYAQALQERRLTAASLLEDAPTDIATDNGLYVPQNYDRRYKSWVSVRTALAASLNVPAVRTLALVTPDAHGRQLRRLGLDLARDGDHHGYSLALGSAEVSLLQLTNAYRTLATGGLSSVPRVWAGRPTQLPPAQRVLDPAVAFIVGDILSDRLARARTFGTDSVLATRTWSAVKTGTSKDMRDNWAVGYTQRFTVGVWVGNASGQPMRAVSGTSGAALVWAEIVSGLHAHEPSRPPLPPPGLVRQAIDFGDRVEAPRSEWFLRGTQMARVDRADVASTSAGGVRITAPTSGTIVALDPDIPPERQTLRFAAPGHRGTWLLDGRIVARGPEWQWQPLPGRHEVSIQDAQGQRVDVVRIEVRGAALRPGVNRAAARPPSAPPA